MPDLAFDLRYLKYAMLVAEHGSFRRAAESLSLSQSTVSRRIKLLERRLGAPLFERKRTGAKPTVMGERFMRAAAVGAEHLRQAVNEMALVQRGDAGELRIGLVASLAQGGLGDILEAFRCKFPKVEVRLQEATSQANAACVLSGRLDIAFIPGEPRLPGCEAKHVWDEELFVAMSTQHRLATREGVTWNDLRNETFLICSDVHGPEVDDIIVRNVSALGFHPKISVHSVGRENLINLVGRKYGLTLAASSTLGATYPGVTFVPIFPRNESIRWSAVWSSDNQNPVLKRLLDLSTTPARRV
ncbi:LysR family transcriptional regulator [Roseomonas hellenica]|uniref:LysR family transcriptional regulator n=1 Tax=Plastoroseomonas hellenica TaxID=2687306 RepID=A0ABS5EX81_9PROT|nr:LysR family transcriptional regulator [Plastoroseomonas hellenica]